jgi:hypothetical protein
LPNEPGTMEMQGATKLASIDIRKTGITIVNKTKNSSFHVYLLMEPHYRREMNLESW